VSDRCVLRVRCGCTITRATRESACAPTPELTEHIFFCVACGLPRSGGIAFEGTIPEGRSPEDRKEHGHQHEAADSGDDQ